MVGEPMAQDRAPRFCCRRGRRVRCCDNQGAPSPEGSVQPHQEPAPNRLDPWPKWRSKFPEPSRRLKCRAPRSHATAETATREGADDQFEPTHRSCNRCRRRRGNHRAAGVRASAAGSSPAGLAGGPQDRILREGRCPHPLRRDRLGLPAAGDARRRPELAHDQLAERGDQHRRRNSRTTSA